MIVRTNEKSGVTASDLEEGVWAIQAADASNTYPEAWVKITIGKAAYFVSDDGEYCKASDFGTDTLWIVLDPQPVLVQGYEE